MDTQKTSLRAKILGMNEGDTLIFPLNLSREITIRGYASNFRVLGRQYAVHRRNGKDLEVKRVR